MRRLHCLVLGFGLAALLPFGVVSPAVADEEAALLQRRAIERIDRFIDTFRRTGDRTSLRPELAEAARELAEAAELFHDEGDAGQVALSLAKLGDALRMLDQSDAALAAYREAGKAAQRAGDTAGEARALMGQAKTELYSLGDRGAAAEHIREAVRLGARTNDRDLLFNALSVQAHAEIGSGDLIGAFETLSRAFGLLEEVKSDELRFFGHLDRADVYQQLATRCDYKRAFEPCYRSVEQARAEYEQALALAERLGWRGLAAESRGFLGRLEARRALIQSRERLVRELASASVFHPRKPGDVLVSDTFLGESGGVPPDLLALARQTAGGGDARSAFIRGLFHEMQGDNDRALASFLEAVDLLEGDRRRLRDEEARGSFLEDKIEFYYKPILHLLERGRVADAFALLERSRSRALADLLESQKLELGGGASRELYARSLELKARIAVLQRELYASRSRPDRERYESTIASAEEDIRKLEAEHRALLGRIEREAPTLQSLLVSEPVSLAALQASARRDRYEVLYYLVTDNAVVVWLIGGDRVRVRSVFLPRSELGDKVSALRKSLTDPSVSFDEQTARELFLFLVEPVRQWIGTDHLVVVPHEDLHYIPFQALQDPQSRTFLGERFRLSYAPSATVLIGLDQVGDLSRGSLLAVADPDIPEATKEVEAIARLYPGRATVVAASVSKADLKVRAARHTILHLSVHGVFSAREPLLSYLKINSGGPDDGKLTAAEMFGLPLEQARLVVLSACETGRAEATHANEIVGMVRALLYAGADSLVLSHWKVDATSTALWMERFYREAQSKPPGEAARLALAAVRQDPRFAHPYHWAAFLLVGR
jgi:CHAT domain-containing protein/tetratricopeptide (TPR) repeat protein